MSFRPYDIAVSAKTFWLLQRVAAAKRAAQASFVETPPTADKIAEEILAAYMANKFPELAVMFDQREKVNQDAENIITKVLSQL